MEVRDQLHFCNLLTGAEFPDIHWIRDWMGPETVWTLLQRQNTPTFLRIESWSSIPRIVTILTSSQPPLFARL